VSNKKDFISGTGSAPHSTRITLFLLALPEGYTLSLSKGLGVGSIFLCEMLSTEKNNRANPLAP
jgi:hypothetical protein